MALSAYSIGKDWKTWVGKLGLENMDRKAMMRLLLAGVVLAAGFCFAVPAAKAHGDAPWCAVVSAGPAEVEWDCEYGSIEECRPNVLAGNRGFCTQNPRFPDGKTAKTVAKRAHKAHRRHPPQPH